MASKNVRKVTRKILEVIDRPKVGRGVAEFEMDNPTVYERAVKRVNRILRKEGGVEIEL